MDQLRKAWSWLQRHHFWVLTVVACAIALGCWFRGASALYAEFMANKQKIESEFTRQTTLQQPAVSPQRSCSKSAKRTNRQPAGERQQAVEATVRTANGRCAQVAQQPERGVSQLHREAQVRRQHPAGFARPLQQLREGSFPGVAQDRRCARDDRRRRGWLSRRL